MHIIIPQLFNKPHSISGVTDREEAYSRYPFFCGFSGILTIIMINTYIRITGNISYFKSRQI